jgi:oxygen-dependent protoporphyrinogen oxidase
MTAGLDANLSGKFGQLRYSSSATINLAYRREQIGHQLNGFGFVVPHIERRTIIAATFSHVKFAGRAPEGRALLRAFIGGALNEDIYALDDEELRRAAAAELTELLGICGEPIFTVLNRWPRSMPQYAVGHLDRVAEITRLLAGLPPAAVAGNAFGGVGIPDCVRSGEQAAETVLTALGHPVPKS